MILTSSSCKLRARSIPSGPGRRQTPIRMICQRSMCILWVFSITCSYSQPTNASLCSLNRSHWLRNGRSSCINLIDVLGFDPLIAVLCEQMDKRKDRGSLRRAAPPDLSPQRDAPEPPYFYGHTCEARDIRRVSYVSAVLLCHLVKVSNLTQ